MRALSLTVFLLLCACSVDVSAEEPAPAAEPAVAQASPVSRIVFIGQQQACDCTTKRIADGEAALTSALGGREIPIERLHLDDSSHRESVDMHRELQAFMVAPAIFFFDGEDKLVKMTQGEVSVEELSAILGPS